jgi:alkanesulfonate monooxygenase SsuD/methylene tetrahydromethanopterin reductase-like flavin-dependent oxidoreductase (luciferase family)
MLLSLVLDPAPGPGDPALFQRYLGDIDRLAAADPDVVVLGRHTPDGELAAGRLEAIVALPWLAGRLTRPILIAAVPALHSVPFHIARALSAADFVSGGRAGWAPVATLRTLFDAAYGGEVTADADIVAKADDFIRATQALWDSWDEDALVLDKASGVYLDSARVRRVHYKGPFFSIMGPLNAARPPQGYPILLRDLDDLAQGAVAADIVIGEPETIAKAPSGVRLLKTTREWLEENLAAVEAGAAEGLHVAGDDAIDLLETLRARYPAPAAAGQTGRARLGLAKPANAYDERRAS